MASTHLPSMHRLPAAALLAAATLVALGLPAVGQEPTTDPPVSPVSGTITLYTSVTQDTIDAVLAALERVHPDLEVEVFRAPTGELDARIATEQRIGGIGADVLWLSDPLSMERYQADGLLAPLEADVTAAVDPVYRGDTFVGTRLLNVVIVARPDLDPMPTTWEDLADPAFGGRIAIPDPGFAGSAFAVLGYLASAEGPGLELYRELAAAGAVTVQSPVDVLTGVAEGAYDAGISLDKVVRDAITAGSPVELVWPGSGAIAVVSPAAVVAASGDLEAAQAFQAFLVSREAQEAIAASGWQPVRDDIAWPDAGPVVAPDWGELYASAERLLEDYDAIFGD